jgi:glycogen debranching enzyme
MEHYGAYETGQIAEIADGVAPHTPRGCPFQAWSVGEALRLSDDVLRVDSRATLLARMRSSRIG